MEHFSSPTSHFPLLNKEVFPIQWLWLLVIVGALGIDLATSNIFFVSFSLGGLVALLAQWLGAMPMLQYILFAAVSGISLAAGYPLVKRALRRAPKNVSLNQRILGREITLEEEIERKGVLKIDGVYWTVKNDGPPIRKGEKAQIVGVEGNKIVITRDWEE
ncbi:MAG: NfeD family protein [Bacillota bacterium]